MTRSRTPAPSRRERRAAARLEPRQPRGRARRSTTRPAWQSPIVIISVVAVLVGAVIIAFGLPKDEPRGELVIPAMAYTSDITDGDVLGSADAPVVMDLYSDFQCPACKAFVKDQLAGLVNDFVKPGILRIEARDIVIIDRGGSEESLRLAIGGACAAAQDRYWQYHDIVFWNQGRENKGDHDAAFIASVADAAGVDRAAWDACIARDDVATAVRTQTADALASGVSGTPTVIVNGENLGFPSYSELAAKIQGYVASPSPDASETAAP